MSSVSLLPVVCFASDLPSTCACSHFKEIWSPTKTEFSTDAERVVKKEQSMRDEEFPKDYTLTVFKFTTDVSIGIIKGV